MKDIKIGQNENFDLKRKIWSEKKNKFWIKTKNFESKTKILKEKHFDAKRNFD